MIATGHEDPEIVDDHPGWRQETTPLSGRENSRVGAINESTARGLIKRQVKNDSQKKTGPETTTGPLGALLSLKQMMNRRYQYSTTTSPWGTLQQDRI
jgi:hypothetical protein